MITLIGTAKTIIGFGLCGIKDVHELAPNAEPKTILEAVEKAGEIVMIEQGFHAKIKEGLPSAKIYIQIPDEIVASDDIDALVRDTIGVSMKS